MTADISSIQSLKFIYVLWVCHKQDLVISFFLSAISCLTSLHFYSYATPCWWLCCWIITAALGSQRSYTALHFFLNPFHHHPVCGADSEMKWHRRAGLRKLGLQEPRNSGDSGLTPVIADPWWCSSKASAQELRGRTGEKARGKMECLWRGHACLFPPRLHPEGME